MNDDPYKLRDAVRALEKKVHRGTEQTFVKELLRSTVKSSPVIDRFSTLLLVGAGATAGLITANSENLLSVLSSEGVSRLLLALSVSALVGLFAKVLSVQAQVMEVIASELEQRIAPIIAGNGISHENIAESEQQESSLEALLDPVYILNEYAKAYPFLVKGWIAREFRKGIEDLLAPDRKAANCVFWQTMLVLIQVALFIFFIILASIYIG